MTQSPVAVRTVPLETARLSSPGYQELADRALQDAGRCLAQDVLNFI